MRTIFAEYNPHRTSIDVYTSSTHSIISVFSVTIGKVHYRRMHRAEI